MGVPDLLAAELAAPFERANVEDAASIALRHWGLATERAHRVDTERDDTFELGTDAGNYALKLSHPGDDPAVIDLQTAAIEWAAVHDSSLSIARPLSSLDGTLQPVVPVAGTGRIARIFPWMPGQSLRAELSNAAPTPQLLHAIGATQGRLSVALAGFRHPAESRVLAWDVAQLASLAGLIEAVERPGPVAAALEQHISDVAPRIADLPQQVIHNDGNLDNLLVDLVDQPRITVLDFGDVVRTARVLDLAVATSYLLPADDSYRASDTLASMTDGWASVLALAPEEQELLPRLVIARLLQRILLGSWLARERPSNADYLGRNIAHTRAQLAIALTEGW
ncbi:MAG: phosphotransferase [Pseudolysinimonas sp.]